MVSSIIPDDLPAWKPVYGLDLLKVRKEARETEWRLCSSKRTGKSSVSAVQTGRLCIPRLQQPTARSFLTTQNESWRGDALKTVTLHGQGGQRDMVMTGPSR